MFTINTERSSSAPSEISRDFSKRRRRRLEPGSCSLGGKRRAVVQTGYRVLAISGYHLIKDWRQRLLCHAPSSTHLELGLLSPHMLRYCFSRDIFRNLTIPSSFLVCLPRPRPLWDESARAPFCVPPLRKSKFLRMVEVECVSLSSSASLSDPAEGGPNTHTNEDGRRIR